MLGCPGTRCGRNRASMHEGLGQVKDIPAVSCPWSVKLHRRLLDGLRGLLYVMHACPMDIFIPGTGRPALEVVR